MKGRVRELSAGSRGRIRGEEVQAKQFAKSMVEVEVRAFRVGQVGERLVGTEVKCNWNTAVSFLDLEKHPGANPGAEREAERSG